MKAVQGSTVSFLKVKFRVDTASSSVTLGQRDLPLSFLLSCPVAHLFSLCSFFQVVYFSCHFILSSSTTLKLIDSISIHLTVTLETFTRRIEL